MYPPIGGTLHYTYLLHLSFTPNFRNPKLHYITPQKIMTSKEIEYIKENISLPDIVGQNVILHRSGTGYTCLCPFHSERTPSFHIYPPDSNTPYWHFHCFGCGKSGDVISFVMERDKVDFQGAVKKLAESLHFPVSDKIPTTQHRVQQKPLKCENKPYYLNLIKVLGERESDKSDFCQFLSTIFSDEQVKEVVNRYHLGTTYDNHVIFWQVDCRGFIRSGKIMRYDTATGHRLRNGDKDLPDWVHSRLRLSWQRTHAEDIASIFCQIGCKKFIQPSKWHLNQVLFGGHLLHDTPKDVPVAIAESEKTAVIMSIVKPSMIWLSCGGYSSLKTCLCGSHDSLLGRRIILFADKTKGINFCDGWKQVASEFKDLFLSVSDMMEHTSLPAGADIADIFIAAAQQQRQEQPQPTQQQPKIVVKFDPMEGMDYPVMNYGAEWERIMSQPQPQECPF